MGLETVFDRREANTLCTMYIILSDIVSRFLISNVPPRVQECVHYSFRNQTDTSQQMEQMCLKCRLSIQQSIFEKNLKAEIRNYERISFNKPVALSEYVKY